MAGRSVLVVDDEPNIVALLVDLLEGEGYEVRRAPDGVAALAEVDRAVPDIVIADVMMPRLDGITLAARLRERSIPTVLMSAAIPPPRDPCVVFISKPFDIDEILEVIGQVLESC